MIVSIGCAGRAIGWWPIPDPGDGPAPTSDSSSTVWETTQPACAPGGASFTTATARGFQGVTGGNAADRTIFTVVRDLGARRPHGVKAHRLSTRSAPRRNAVERRSSQLTRWRGVATRHGKLALSLCP